MDSSPAWIAGAVSAILAVLSSVVSSTVAFVRSKTHAEVMIGVLEKRVDENSARLQGSDDSHDNAIKASERVTGEGLAAIRHALGESSDKLFREISRVELFGANNYVNKDDLRDIIGGVNRSIDSLRELVASSTRDVRGEIAHMRESIETKIEKMK